MDLSSWRDIVLIIWGVVATIAVAFIAIILFLFYRQTISLLKSSDLVVAKVRDIVDYADEELLGPVRQFGTMIQGIARSISFISNIFKKKEDQDE